MNISDFDQSPCSLFVDDNLAAQNVFLGFYSPPDLTSQSSHYFHVSRIFSHA